MDEAGYAETVRLLRAIAVRGDVEAWESGRDPAGRALVNAALRALRELPYPTALAAIEEADADWLLAVILRRSFETVPDPDELIEIEPGITKRRGDCTVTELRRAADVSLESASVHAELLGLLDDVRASGSELPAEFLDRWQETRENPLGMVQLRDELAEIVRRETDSKGPSQPAT
jgi:hypothetical protein